MDDAEVRADFLTRLGAVATATGTRFSVVRARLAVRLVTHLGASLADAARHLGVSTSGLAKAVARAERE